MKVVFAHVCDYATQGANGKPILVGVFTRIKLEKLPGGIRRFHVFVCTETGPEDADQEQVIKIELVDPDNVVVFGEEAHSPAEPLQKATQRFINRIWERVAFTKYGDHVIRVTVSNSPQPLELPFLVAPDL